MKEEEKNYKRKKHRGNPFYLHIFDIYKYIPQKRKTTRAHPYSN